MHLSEDARVILAESEPLKRLFEDAEEAIFDFTARVAMQDLDSDEGVTKARALKAQLKGMIHMLDTLKALVNEPQSEPA